MRISEITQSEDLEEYKTKKNQEIDIELIEDSEGDNNRGWIVHKFIAYIDEKEAGYLKISYIPEERFKRWYPSIFNYLSQIEGSPIIPYKLRGKDWRKYDTTNLIDVYKNVNWMIFHNDMSVQKIKFNRKQLIQKINSLEHKVEEEKGKEFNDFRNYFVDKPLVDYINVEQNYQRQRIAISLYLTAANWFKERNLLFFASTTQSDSAKSAWSFLEKNYTVKTVKDFYFKPTVRRYLKV